MQIKAFKANKHTSQCIIKYFHLLPCYSFDPIVNPDSNPVYHSFIWISILSKH